MKYIIYIQTLLGEFPDSFFYDAYIGFKNKGLKVIKFESINEIPVKWEYNHASVVVSFVEDTIKYFSKIDRNLFTMPKPINIPDELNSFHFLKRNVEVKTMGEFINEKTTYPIFIKPKDKLKLFAGGVITKESSKSFFNEISSDTNVITTDYIDIISEYRVFVKFGEICGIKHYLGDYFTFPNKERILEMIDKYKGAPSAYTLDVGIMSSSETILIECNDAWSITSYGLEPDVYSQLLLVRWCEIMQQTIKNQF